MRWLVGKLVGSLERVQRGFVTVSGSFGRTRGRHLPFCVIIWESAKYARDVQVHLHCPGGRRLTPGAPPWARAAPGRYHGTMQRNERCLGGRPGVKSPGRRQNCPAPDGGGDQGEVHFRRCTHRTSSSCRPRCHRWSCDTATEPQLVRLRRVRLRAAMCRTWEGRFSLQVVMTMVGAVGA